MSDNERRLLMAVSEAMFTYMCAGPEICGRWREFQELHDALVSIKLATPTPHEG